MTDSAGDTALVPQTSARRAALWLLPLLLTPLLIAQCFSAPFLSFDDATYIKLDPRLAADAPLSAALTHRSHYPFYYPATMLSWKLDRIVWGNVLEPLLHENAWPAGTRITNLLLHLGAAVFLWLVLRRLRAPDALAGFVVAAFALHPTACESVCWAVERKNVLAACLAFAALWSYLSAEKIWHHAVAVLLFALAILSKPSALGLFAVVAGWEALGRPDFTLAPAEAFARRWRQALLRLLPWIAVAAAGTALGFVMHEENVLPPPGGNVFTALLTDAEILWRYIVHFIWPAQLSAYYCVLPIVSLAEPRLWANGVPLVLMIATMIICVEPPRRRIMAFSWLWFLGAMGTNLNLVGINDLMHDRFVYLSSPGFWMAIALAAPVLYASATKSSRAPAWLPALAVALLALVWSASSFSRGERFSLAAKLFEDAVAKQPQSSYARIFLAADYRTLAYHKRKTGRKDEANELMGRSFASLEAGVRSPDFERYLHKSRARADLALAYQQRGFSGQAELQAQAALAADNDDGAEADAHIVLGNAAMARNELNEALAHFDQAILKAPGYRSVHVNRATVLLLIQNAWIASGDRAKADAAKAEAAASLRSVRPDDEGFQAAQDLLLRIEQP